jgi:hypothetical protein
MLILKHANIIQTWGYNCNKTKVVCIDTNIKSIKTFFNVQKLENMNSIPLFMPKKLCKIYMLFFNLKRPLLRTIFINHHVMCSSISSCCYNHLGTMLMNVKLIVIQLELNGMSYKLVFLSYSKFASNTWYTLICKFEKCKPNPKKILSVNITSSTRILKTKKLEK